MSSLPKETEKLKKETFVGFIYGYLVVLMSWGV